MKSVHPKGRTTMRTGHRPDDAALGDLRAVARQALTRRGWRPPTAGPPQPRSAFSLGSLTWVTTATVSLSYAVAPYCCSMLTHKPPVCQRSRGPFSIGIPRGI
jgi:hypothetical protein